MDNQFQITEVCIPLKIYMNMSAFIYIVKYINKLIIYICLIELFDITICNCMQTLNAGFSPEVGGQLAPLDS